MVEINYFFLGFTLFMLKCELLEKNLLNMIQKKFILQTMTGGSQFGVYMNEADPNEPEW
jgi:hypothetical protein